MSQTTLKKPTDVCRKPCKEVVSAPFSNLSDFTGTYCQVCFKVLNWQKIKPLKASEKEAPSAVSELPNIKVSKAKPTEEKPKFVLDGKPDTVVEKKPVIPIPVPPANPERRELAPAAPPPIAEPVKTEVPAQEISPELTGQFQVFKIERMPLMHLLLMYLVTEHGEEFSCMLDAGTEEKAGKIFQIKEQINGRMVNITFEKWHDNKPFGLRFKGFVK